MKAMKQNTVLNKESQLDMLAFVKNLTEQHQQEKNALRAKIRELEKEIEELKSKQNPTDLLINKGVAPFVRFSLEYIEQLMREMDDEFREKLRESLNVS